MRLYYHGALVKSVGGCNFEMFERHVNRTFAYVNHTYVPTGDYNKDYEMPYYKWEADLDQNGNEQELESTGSWKMHGFRGIQMFREAPDEKHLTHERMRK